MMMTTIALNGLNDEGARDIGSLGMVYFYSYFYFTLWMMLLQIDYAYDGHHNTQWPPQ